MVKGFNEVLAQISPGRLKDFYQGIVSGACASRVAVIVLKRCASASVPHAVTILESTVFRKSLPAQPCCFQNVVAIIYDIV
jgi:hypothetical protein